LGGLAHNFINLKQITVNMRLASAWLLLLVLATFSYGGAPCIACEQFSDTPQANIILLVDEQSTALEANVYYENLTATPSRLPITDSALIVEISNSTGLSELYKIFTDDKGKAVFNYTQWKDGCVNFRVLYCPFCDPAAVDETCGFLECMNYANMPVTEGNYDNIAGEIEDAGDIEAIGSPEGALSTEKYIPNLAVTTYCPAPAPDTSTPPLCLPLILVFSLLAGSLYMTGKNPFASFNIGGARIGRHIRYQARGRGFYMNVQMVVGAALSVAGAVKSIKKDGFGKFAADEHARQMENIPFVGMIRRAAEGAKRMKKASQLAKKMGKQKGAPSFARRFGKAYGVLASGDTGRAMSQIAGPDGAVVGGIGGGSTVRASDLMVEAGGGVSEFGAVMGTLGRAFAFLLTQTIFMRQIGGFYQVATGRSLETDLFANHKEWLQANNPVAQAQKALNGGLAVMRTLQMPDGTTRTVETGVVSVKKDVIINLKGDRGTVTTMRADKANVGDGVGQVGGVGKIKGNIKVISNKAGKIIQYRYVTRLQAGGDPVLLEVNIGEGAPGATGQPPVTVRAIPYSTETEQVPVQEFKPDGTPVTVMRTQTTSYEDETRAFVAQGVPGPDGQLTFKVAEPAIPEIEPLIKITSAATAAYTKFTETNTDLQLGDSIKPFHKGYAAAAADFNVVVESTIQSLQEERLIREKSMRDAIKDISDPGQRKKVSQQVFNSQEGAADQQVGLLTGTKPTDAATMFLGNKYDQPGQEAESLAHEVATTSGLSGSDADTFRRHAAGILANSSLGQLSSMTEKTLETQLTASMEREGVEASTISRITTTVKPQHVGVISQRTNEFMTDLKQQENFRPALMDSVKNADLNQVSRTIMVGHDLQSGNSLQLLSNNPAATAKLPERVKQEVREYRFLQSMQAKFSQVRREAEGGNMGAAFTHLTNYGAMNTGYMDASALHLAQREGVLKGGEYLEGAKAMDAMAQGFRVLGQTATPEQLASEAMYHSHQHDFNSAMRAVGQMYEQARQAGDKSAASDALGNMERLREAREERREMTTPGFVGPHPKGAGVARMKWSESPALTGNRRTGQAVQGIQKGRQGLASAAGRARDRLRKAPEQKARK
jgi:hypothetical protein